MLQHCTSINKQRVCNKKIRFCKIDSWLKLDAIYITKYLFTLVLIISPKKKKKKRDNLNCFSTEKETNTINGLHQLYIGVAIIGVRYFYEVFGNSKVHI